MLASLIIVFLADCENCFFNFLSENSILIFALNVFLSLYGTIKPFSLSFKYTKSVVRTFSTVRGAFPVLKR